MAHYELQVRRKNKTIHHELKMSPQISVFFFSYQTKTYFLFQKNYSFLEIE